MDKNWVSVPGRWDTQAKALREGVAWLVFKNLKRDLCRQWNEQGGVYSFLGLSFPLYVRRMIDVPPGSPQFLPEQAFCSKRSLGEQWEVLIRLGPNCSHVTLAMSPSPSPPGADSKLRVVPDSLLW